MGINCRITLPGGACIRDVADVMAALAGHPCYRRELGNTWWAENNSHRIESAGAGTLTLASIVLPDSSDRQDHHVLYHFEGGENGERLLMPRSTPWWLAIGCGLIEFFGGRIDFNDSDGVDCDMDRPQVEYIHAEDGEGWEALQLAKLAVRPITAQDIKRMAQYAAYDEVPRLRRIPA